MYLFIHNEPRIQIPENVGSQKIIFLNDILLNLDFDIQIVFAIQKTSLN